MNVAQLLGELALARHVEVVVARLPEGLRGAQRQLARDRLLQRLQGLCQAALSGSLTSKWTCSGMTTKP